MRWLIDDVESAHVRLKSGRIGLVAVDAAAPVIAGQLSVESDRVDFALELALDKLTSPNFIMQRAARGIVTNYDGHILRYIGTGRGANAPWKVSGVAQAGTITVELDIVLSPLEAAHPRLEVAVSGVASFGDVSLPIPGMRRVENLTCDVDGHLVMHPNPVA